MPIKNPSESMNHFSVCSCTSFTYAEPYRQDNNKWLSFIFSIFFLMIYDCTTLEYYSWWLFFFLIHCPRFHSRPIESFEKERENGKCGRSMRIVLISTSPHNHISKKKKNPIFILSLIFYEVNWKGIITHDLISLDNKWLNKL
jgi:hypothetical protein